MKQTNKNKIIMKSLEELKIEESHLLHCIEEGYAMLYEENSHQVRSYISNLQSELMDVQAEIRNFKNNQ